MTSSKDRIGQKFGKLTITDVFRSGRYYMAKVVCDCGIEKNVRICALTSGNTTSCGCKRIIDFNKRDIDDTKHIIKDGREITLRKYVRLHIVIVKKYGKPNKCEFCNALQASRYEYALKKGRTYSDNKDDYYQLCPSCHRKYDYNPEQGKKISKKTKGVPKPSVSIALTGRTRPEFWTPVYQKNANGEIVNEFESIRIASKKTGIIRTGIMNALAGSAKTSGGYSWEYKPY